MNAAQKLRQRLRLRHVVFATLLLSGIIPLAISSTLLIRQSRGVLESQQREQLFHTAQSLSESLNGALLNLRLQLQELGSGLVTLTGRGSLAQRLRSAEVGTHLARFSADNPNLLALQALLPNGQGPGFGPSSLEPEVADALRAAFRQALDSGQTQHRLVIHQGSPSVLLAVPVAAEAGGEVQVVVEAMTRLPLLEAVVVREAQEAEIFLVGSDGEIFWYAGATAEAAQILASSELLRDFQARPLNMTTEYSAAEAGREQDLVALVSIVNESGWGLLVQKPTATVFEAVNRMVFNAMLASLLLVALAFLFAVLTARRLSQPIQRLSATSREIASGNFGRRVEMSGLSMEIAVLGESFNRMSRHVESYVAQLRQAAQANRDLFIGALRAFSAAIDAKDPYTRGHSERVAALSRTIARHLSLSDDFQEKTWIAGILHDVGKIGIEDAILKKGGQLSDAEFEEIKLHPVLGAEILSPIEQLKEMLPAVRWHHENWNGRGYPDGLKGEEIPLMARIVAVADTFDAVTTNRPYQEAFTLDEAVKTITRLTGTRFDAKLVTAFLKAYEQGEIKPASRVTRAERSSVRSRAGILTMT